MSKANKSTISVQGVAIAVLAQEADSFISLTDIARTKNAERSDDLVRNWLRNRNTVEFLGIWERLNNADFNSVEFDGIKMQAGLNSFTLTPIHMRFSQAGRLKRLNDVAIRQMQVLTKATVIKQLKEG